jgi:lipoprotein-anchoring transpeptidase ErfK/SrfK
MAGKFGGMMAAVLVVGGLAACVPDPSLTGATSNVPAAPLVPAAKPVGVHDEIYAARQDGAFTIPAVPYEQVPEALRRQEVAFATEDPAGTIIINPAQRTLHLVTGPNRAIRYGISVGKAGFEWAGEAIISDRKHWPNWYPPEEMIARKPELEKWKDGQPGGPTNPLGARALYLTTNGRDYGYRIHGTPEWDSIGRNASSGCIRMINQDVIDLYERVPNGVKVVVLNADGSRPQSLKLPPPAPKAKKPAAKPRAAPKPEAASAPATPAAPLGLPQLQIVPPPAIVTGAPAPGVGAPAAPATPAAVPVVTPAAPAPTEPPAVVTPIAPATPAATPAAPQPVAPTVAPPALAPACPVPLVNGACPQG